MITVLAAVIIVIAIDGIRRGYDVRLVLILAGVLLASLVGKPTLIFDSFINTLGNQDVVGPICSAMGYAFVLKEIGADKELVALLARPLRMARWLMVPGGCVLGFITNMAIPSQTATAAAVGPILIPLMVAAGYSRLAAGATLLLGCSIGGNLWNPGDGDVVSVRLATGVPVEQVISAAFVPNLISLTVATLVLMLVLRNNNADSTDTEAAQELSTTQSISLRRVALALLAPLPIIAAFALMPQFNLFPRVTEIYPHGIAISSVMLTCALIAILVSYIPRSSLKKHASDLSREFFQGMGYGLGKVVSVILAATCFIAGLNAVGFIKTVTALFLGSSSIATLASPTITWLLAMLSGSGTAPAVAFAQAVLPSFVQHGQTAFAVTLGVFAGIGASAGRTMSPVSAVMFFVSDLSATEPKTLIQTVALPIVAALIAVIMYGLVFS